MTYTYLRTCLMTWSLLMHWMFLVKVEDTEEEAISPSNHWEAASLLSHRYALVRGREGGGK